MSEAEKLALKVKKGEFDFDDMLSQLRQLKKMGGLSGVMNLLPGVAKVKAQIQKLQDDGYGHYPVCVAKTQSSFSTSAAAQPSLRAS